MITSTKKRVVIIGAGFAGLNAAHSLANEKNIEVILIDQRNHHLFQPLLYQVATAGLGVDDIAVPIRAQFSRSSNVQVHLTQVKCVCLEKKQIETTTGETFVFDNLIVACGVRHSYFGHPEWEEVAPGLKTLEQATEIRRRILSAFEEAENETNPERQKALLAFVVVGGGPTGVELAGAIADISRTVLVRDFKRIDASGAKVFLVEGGPRVLSSFSTSLSTHTVKALEEIGVTVKVGVPVDNITKEGVQIGDEFIPSKTVLWAAGVEANELELVPAVERDRSGRIQVNPDLSLPGFPDCFAVGDIASLELKRGVKVPGVAPAAIQMGRHCAKIIRQGRASERAPFIYLDKGQLATIGKYRAVMQFHHIETVGVLAWMGWVVIHILYLIGFKNKISVFLIWMWSYLLSKRGSRLIISKEWRQGRGYS